MIKKIMPSIVSKGIITCIILVYRYKGTINIIDYIENSPQIDIACNAVIIINI